jgi:DNA-binding protein HU-beta
MKKSELVEQVAEKAQTSKAAAAKILDAEAVKAGEQVSIPGFGKFKPRKRPARKGRNPRTGAEIDIPERTVVAFTPGKGLRETLEGSSSGSRSGASSSAKGKSSGKGGGRS